MVTPNDHAKVLDFGLAIMEGEVAEAIEVIGGKGYVVGSVDYMAPEQTFDATDVDGRSDLYALGCVLFFALTGKPPLAGSTTKEKVNAHRHTEPNPVQWLNHDVPDAFANLVHKLLAKKPGDRYASAAQVRAAFGLVPARTGRTRGKRRRPNPGVCRPRLASAPLTTQVLKDTDPAPLFEAPERRGPLLALVSTGLFYLLVILLALAMFVLV